MKTRVKHSPRQLSAGYIEIDTVTRFYQGRKIYIVNGIDICTRLNFSHAYRTLTSTNTRDYLIRLQRITSFHTIQTDNGLEFQGEFEDYLQMHHVTHLFTYPRSPRINGYIERADRSLSEEFLEDNLMHMDNIDLFNYALHEYTLWYNTKRVHRGLKNLTPMNFILNLPTHSHIY